jgi:hypothetical protein
MFEALLALQSEEYREMPKESDNFKAAEKPIT